MNENKPPTSRNTPASDLSTGTNPAIKKPAVQEATSKDSTDSKKASSPVQHRSTRAESGRAQSDAEAKARARSSFYSSSSIRSEITKLEAENKNRPRAGPHKLASSRALSSRSYPNQRRVSKAATSSLASSIGESSAYSDPSRLLSRRPGVTGKADIDELIAYKTGIPLSEESTSVGTVQECVELRKPGHMSLRGNSQQSSSSLSLSGLTRSRDIDELIAYKTGIPLDPKETGACSEESTSVGAVQEHVELRKPGRTSLRGNTRQSSSSVSLSGLPRSREIDERIAHKTGIPLDPKEIEACSEESRGGSSVQVLAELRPPGQMSLRGSSQQNFSAASRSGLTGSRDLDELIAYKTGIPLESEGNLESSSTSGHRTSPFPSDAKIASKVEFDSFDSMLETKLDGAPRLHASTDRNSVAGEMEAGDLVVAEQIEEETENAFIPSAVEYDVEAKPPIYKNRRFRLYGALAIGLILVAVISTVGIVVQKKAKANDGTQPTLSPEVKDENVTIMAQLELVVGKEQLSNPQSAHYRAMKWIMEEDPQKLGYNATNLVQRFLLVAFYLQTHENGDWLSCNAPNETHTDDTCFFQQLVDIYPHRYRSLPTYRWMSAAHECDWAGIECIDESLLVNEIDLKAQGISGTLPVELTYLRFLQTLAISWNSFSGTMPAEYGHMRHLVTFECHFNEFTGTIPTQWSEAKNLQSFNIGGNYLTGTLPLEIQEMVSLKGMFLFSNALTGEIPSSLANMNLLAYIRLHKNFLSGTLPTELGLLSPREIWLQKQAITGTIPSEFGEMGEISDLRLQGSRVNGTIPDELWTLRNLVRLDLSTSNLSGTLSSKVGQLQNLVQFKISDNQLSGQIPSALSQISSLAILWLYGNDLTGNMPTSLCDRKESTGLKELVADCLPSNQTGLADVSCTCCDICCDGDLGVCIETHQQK